jgi:prevent-host-death family protein
MAVTATEFRKNLFPLLERAVRGEVVEVVYKGASVRVQAAAGGSKLSRARRQRALLVDPEAIVHSDPDLLREMEAGWRHDWKEL